MSYTVEIETNALKTLEKIPQAYARKIRDRIRLLAIDPRHNGSIKLSGQDKAYRTRVGRYRVIYEIFDSKILVVVVSIDHRKDAYR